MRRISLAMALIGAAAAAGCAGSPAPAVSTGTQQGVQGKYYFVNLFTPPMGGYVTSDIGGINCGASAVTVVNVGTAQAPDYQYQYTFIPGRNVCGAAPANKQTQIDWAQTVTLTAVADTGNVFVGWAGDCAGTATCVLSAGADKTVVAIFSRTGQAGHPNWTDQAIHGPAYRAYIASAQGALQCGTCHGADLLGQSIAPSCGSCHIAPPAYVAGQAQGKHFDPAGLAWVMHGAPGTGWSQGCQRCHTSAGFRDYVGADGSAPNNLSGAFNSSIPFTTDTTSGAWASFGPSNSFGQLQCVTCHPDGAGSDLSVVQRVPGDQIRFPSLKTVTTNSVTALCGTCHQARESTASITSKITAGATTGFKGLGTVAVTSSVTGSSGTTTTLVKSGFTASAYRGYTAIFAGNVTPALNGATTTVSDNTATTLTFATTLPAAPANTLLPQGTVAGNLAAYAAATDGSTTTLVNAAAPFGAANAQVGSGKAVCFVSGLNDGACAVITASDATTLTFGAVANPVVAGDRYIVASRSADSVTLYPTATGGTTATLVDGNRTWTANQWQNYYVYFQTGANAGLYRLIASNDATTLTLTGALPAAPAAGDLYQVAVMETAAVLDVGALSFSNSHYLGAAATFFGAEAAGWYQYPRNAAATIPGAYAVYTGRNQHGVTAGKCTSCHNTHAGKIEVSASTCGRCHFKADGRAVTTLAELEEERQFGFEGDIDGLGTPSLKAALDNNAAKLFAGIQAYAANVLVPAANLCYTTAVYPYFFADTNGNGVCDGAEAVNANAFSKFTPRLLRAAYNYNFYMREPGAWAHNPRYVAEILYDAIVDVNAGLTAALKTPVPFNGARAFNGHFGGLNKGNRNGGDTFRDWDAAVVPNNCSQCHAGQAGVANYLVNQATTITNQPVDGMQCTTCHAPVAGDPGMARIRSDIAQVYFPPRKAAAAQVAVLATTLPKDFALCATCHSGRENKASIDTKIGATTTWTLTFTNPHYLGAAAVLLGSDTHMMYEYAGQTYAGKPIFWGAVNGNAPGPHGSPHGASCTGCHQPKASRHGFEADLAWCGTCHVTAPYGDFRLAPLKANVDALAALLYTTLTAYSQTAGNAVCYNGAAFPYWYKDNGASPNDGICQADETATATFNPAGLKAAFNYKWSQAEPGAYAHNYEYMVQILMDTILDLNPAATMPVDAKAGTAFMPAGTLIARPVTP